MMVPRKDGVAGIARRRSVRMGLVAVAIVIVLVWWWLSDDPNCIPERAHLCKRWQLQAPEGCVAESLLPLGNVRRAWNSVNAALGLQPIADDASCENKTLWYAFSSYNADPQSRDAVPVYATACVYGVDCHWMAAQLRSLTFPIGHLYIAVGRDMNRTLTSPLSAAAALFPGRMTVLEAATPVGFGCAQWWNTALRDAFAKTELPEYVMIVNGDVWWKNPTGIARLVRAQTDAHALVLLQWFSAFALTKRAWLNIGAFDENIWPAYGEDDEFQIRMKAAGEKLIELKQPTSVLVHGGAMTVGDPSFKTRARRWNKNDYIYRKWGINLKEVWDVNDHHYKLPRFTPFAHPFNLTALSVRDWVLDQAHRDCIRTGNGVRLRVPAGRKKCFESECAACYWNASVLLEKLPPGTELPDRLTTTRRLAL